MARLRLDRGLVAIASAGLVASSLLTVPAEAADGSDSNPTPNPGSGSTHGSPASAADFVVFRDNSSNLTKATRSRLTRLADRFTGSGAQGRIVAYTNAKSTADSTRLAQSRATNIRTFLQESGVDASLQVVTEPGSTALQRQGALIHLEPAGSSVASTDQEAIRSLIVRLKKGRSITVDGAVRGSEKVTGPLGDSLSVGPYLGLRMYRVDFPEPVSIAVAERIAKQLMLDPGIQFVEPDSFVSTQVSITL